MSQSVAVMTPLRAMPRWLWVTLVVSLALNLLLIGLIAGAAVFRHRWGGPGVAPGQALGYLRTLPKERRDQVRQTNRDLITGMRPMWQAVGEARREADRLFSSDPFDAAKFIAAHQRMVDAEATARKASAQLLAATGAQLSLDERKAMLSWRERHGRRWQGRGQGQDDLPSSPEGPGGPPQRP